MYGNNDLTEDPMITADCDGTEGHLFHVHCAPCTASALALRSLEEVASWWEQGVIGSAARDGYRHIWAISATRSAAYDHWMQLPEDPFAREVASALSARVPSGRGYC